MNIDTLLAAISDTSPCGDDLSFSPEFDTIQELRRADDPTLDQGEWVTELKAADWPGVRSRCEQVLMLRSKDLRVAGWLADASARLDGFAGLADGLVLCTRLCERYWDEMHPRIEDGDTEQRGGNLRWLLAQVQTLTPQLSVLPHSQLADAQRAEAALQGLQQIVDARLGAEGPGFAEARQALQDAVHRAALQAGALPDAAAVAGGGAASGADGASASATGVLRTRADALRQLRAVAEFFRRTEPHSPVAYLAERAAKWGEMPLHDWLRAVVKDAGTLSTMEELLGVNPPKPPAD